MDKKKTEIIVTSILAVIFIFALANSIRVIKKKTVALPQPTPALLPEPEPQKPHPQEEMEWNRCPFSGKFYNVIEGQSEAITLKLSGILWDELDSRALINDEIIKEGDTIGQYSVIKINKNNVIVSDGSKEIELILE